MALPEDLQHLVDRLAPLVATTAVDARRNGKLSDTVIEAADQGGLFATRVPKELGGRDLSMQETFLLTEALSYLDGSTGWTQAFMALSAGLVGGHVCDDGVAEILASNNGRWPRFTGTFPTLGVATQTDGGYTVTGSWPFASGINHAQWVAAGCRIVDPSAPAGVGDPSAPAAPAGAAWPMSTALLWIAVPVERCAIDRTSWSVGGMQATGSYTFRLDEEFVPRQRVFSINAPHGRGSMLHKLSTLVFISPEHAGVALGLARRALDEVARISSGKLRMGGRTALSGRGAFTRDLGRADVTLRVARSLIQERFAEVDAATSAKQIDPRFVAGIRACAAHVASTATDVASLAYRYAGGSAIAQEHPLHRSWSDVFAATQHVHTNDENYEVWGETVLGDATAAGEPSAAGA